MVKALPNLGCNLMYGREHRYPLMGYGLAKAFQAIRTRGGVSAQTWVHLSVRDFPAAILCIAAA